MSGNTEFWNRPNARKGPDVPYENATVSNPVVRGFVLAPLATLLKSSNWLQGVLWRLNKFDQLKEITRLNDYEPRYDPTVIPISHVDDSPMTVSELPQPPPRKKDNQYYTCADYHEFYKGGRITPLQVAEYLLSVITRLDVDKAPDKYSVAFINTKTDLVLSAARASTQRYKDGSPLSLLDGVPVAVKDEIQLQGYPKTQGSSITFAGPDGETGWCVRKWEQAGAIIIGKTNMHEIGLDTNGFNSTWGTPLNPHNHDYYTGGSSSGSACTVAQGICPFALGADGGGSVRIPSNFCGLYGLKPSHGRVSGRPTGDLACSVGVYGPIASSLDDLEIAYRIMSQPDPGSRTSARFPNPLSKTSSKAKPTSKILGIDRDWIARSDPEVLHMFEEAVRFYTTTQGYKVVDISIPYLPENQKAHALTILSEVKAGISSAQMPKLNYHNQVLLTAAGSQALTQDFLAAQRLRSLLMEHLAWLWDEHPGMLILTPTTPHAGWKIKHPNDVAFRGYGASDSNMSLRSMEYVYVANWTGAPAITMPMGYTNEDVPVGLMAMGEWGSEEQLLSWAREGDNLRGDEGIRRPMPEGNWLDVLARVQSL